MLPHEQHRQQDDQIRRTLVNVCQPSALVELPPRSVLDLPPY
jgi:hypothetical protein